MPRPKLKPTEEERRLVKQLAAVGIAQEDIARKIGIRSAKTLREHFREELDSAATDANLNVAGALYNKAVKGDVDAAKFWLIVRGGWRPFQSGGVTQQLPPLVIGITSDDKTRVTPEAA